MLAEAFCGQVPVYGAGHRARRRPFARLKISSGVLTADFARHHAKMVSGSLSPTLMVIFNSPYCRNVLNRAGGRHIFGARNAMVLCVTVPHRPRSAQLSQKGLFRRWSSARPRMGLRCGKRPELAMISAGPQSMQMSALPAVRNNATQT